MSNCHVTAGGGGGAASEPAALPGGVLAPLCRDAWLRGLNAPRVSQMLSGWIPAHFHTVLLQKRRDSLRQAFGVFLFYKTSGKWLLPVLSYIWANMVVRIMLLEYSARGFQIKTQNFKEISTWFLLDCEIIF